MQKTEFTYQRWYLRIFGAAIVLPFVVTIQVLVLNNFVMPDWMFWLFCAFTTILGLVIYYIVTEKKPLFVKKGYYWIKNDIVYIQTNRTYAVKNVTWLKGDTVNAYGFRASMIVVEYGKTKITIFSDSIRKGIDFSQTSLYPIFNKILANNPDLKKDALSEYWYEKGE